MQVATQQYQKFLKQHPTIAIKLNKNLNIHVQVHLVLLMRHARHGTPIYSKEHKLLYHKIIFYKLDITSYKLPTLLLSLLDNKSSDPFPYQGQILLVIDLRAIKDDARRSIIYKF